MDNVKKYTHSNFFTNRDNNTLIKEFEGILHHNPHICNLDAVVGFLRASGYFSLRPFLDNINKVRVLIGINVDKYIAQATRQGKIFFGAEEEVKEECLREIRRDIEHSHYSKEVENGMFQMVKDLIDGKLELRAHPSKKIHAKIYVLYPNDFNQYTQGMAITGSSNLTGNGLGITEERQYEFNVKMDRYDDVKFAKEEFELLWKEAEGCEITADDVKTSIDHTYLKGDASPYDLYIKMLMEYFSDRVMATDDNNPFDMPEGYKKYDYQMDAVEEGYQKLLRYDGFFLADVVGLGKTVIATMIAKKFLIENGRDKTKILVVYPPAVEHNWKATFKDFGIDKYVNFISNGSLSKILDEDNYNYWNADEFDLILVDEAHKFRSHTTSAFEQLQEICKMPRIENGNIPGFKKKVMLISATPMNNTPADIYTEIQLFQDPRRCTIDGVSNLTAFFSPLIKEFKQLKREPNFDISRFKKLAERVRDRVIKPLTVRRTRTDIENVPRYNKDVNGFPKVERPIESRYELNEHLADLFEHAMLTLEKNLTYARYQAIAYLKPEVAQGLYDNAELISRSLAGIRKNGLVKRLESSFYAFQVSLDNFRQANQNMIDMFDRNKVFIAPDLDINMLLESGLSDEEIEEKLNAKAEDNPKNAVFTADDFKPEFIEMLRGDQNTLEMLCSEWADIKDEDDSKFTKFNELLKHKLFKSERNPEQKLVVFSESVDTVEYLARRINRKDVLVISADNRSKQFKTIRENFDANYKTKLNDYNIILTTDVLAEGVNLHRANVIVNYDTPWNSTRLMQRIGRVNRIGSTAKEVHIFNFFPTAKVNNDIELEKKAKMKLFAFHAALGEDSQIYSTDENPESFGLFDKNADEERDEKLRYLMWLRQLKEDNPDLIKRINKMPLRARVGRKSKLIPMSTITFIRNKRRDAFTFIREDGSIEELTFLEAVKEFEARIEEKAIPLHDKHHEQVAKAIELFSEKEEDAKAATKKVVTTQGPNEKKALAYLDGFLHVPNITDEELTLIAKAKRAISTGKFQQLQRDINKLQSATKKAPVKMVILLEQLMKIITSYPLEHVELNTHEVQTVNCMKVTKELVPEIIISESFNI